MCMYILALGNRMCWDPERVQASMSIGYRCRGACFGGNNTQPRSTWEIPSRGDLGIVQVGSGALQVARVIPFIAILLL